MQSWELLYNLFHLSSPLRLFCSALCCHSSPWTHKTTWLPWRQTIAFKLVGMCQSVWQISMALQWISEDLKVDKVYYYLHRSSGFLFFLLFLWANYKLLLPEWDLFCITSKSSQFYPWRVFCSWSLKWRHILKLTHHFALEQQKENATKSIFWKLIQGNYVLPQGHLSELFSHITEKSVSVIYKKKKKWNISVFINLLNKVLHFKWFISINFDDYGLQQKRTNNSEY